MTDVMDVVNDVMATMEGHANNGECACIAFQYICGLEGFPEASEHLTAILAGIAQYSTPEALESNAAHFLSAVIAVGYSIGASAAFNAVRDSLPVTVPDSLAVGEYVEPWGTLPPEDN